LYILYEKEVMQNIDKLNEAWSKPETFAFVTKMSGVSNEWLEWALSRLPGKLRYDHFALLTSGSTGRPKLVVGLRSRTEKLVDVLHDVQDSHEVNETILVLPLTYCYAFVNQWLWSQLKKKRLVVTPGLSYPDLIKNALNKASKAMLCLVGSQIPLLNQYYHNTEFPGIIRLHFAGGAFPEKQMEQIQRLFPKASIFNNFGCAEAMPRLTVRKVEGNDTNIDIGVPLSGVELMIDKEELLLFKSPYRAVAWIDDDGYHEVMDNQWVQTGDKACFEDTGVFNLLGRAGEVFKRYGEKISLRNLAKTITTNWLGQHAFYKETDNAGQDGYVLILSPEPTSDQVRSILKAFRNSWPRTHWPFRIESFAKLPLLPNSKVNIQALSKLKNVKIHWEQRI